jgi:hypothetical protein
LKWFCDRAAIEFSLASHTLRKALAKNSAAPDADGLYTTAQIVAAIYGSMHIEKLATQRELRRKLELENAITTATVLDRSALMKGFAQVADAMTFIISTSGLSREAQEDLQRQLATIPLVCDNVARSQTKLRLSKNGQKPEDVAIRKLGVIARCCTGE